MNKDSNFQASSSQSLAASNAGSSKTPNHQMVSVGTEGVLHALILIKDQWFAVPVYALRDVVEPKKIFKVPVAPREVLGVINLRSRIAVLIDTAYILGMEERFVKPPKEEVKKDEAPLDLVAVAEHHQYGHTSSKGICFTVDWNKESYSFQADAVGEVVGIKSDEVLDMPDSQNDKLKFFCKGLVKRNNEIWLVLDIPATMKSLVATGKGRSGSSSDGKDYDFGIDIGLFENPI